MKERKKEKRKKERKTKERKKNDLFRCGKNCASADPSTNLTVIVMSQAEADHRRKCQPTEKSFFVCVYLGKLNLDPFCAAFALVAYVTSVSLNKFTTCGYAARALVVRADHLRCMLAPLYNT